MWVGRHAGMDVHGIALPGHFIAMAQADGQRIYFDPYHEGKRLELNDCAALITEAVGMELPLAPEMLQPAPAGAIITRLLTNLKGCYLRGHDFRRAARTIRRLRKLQPDDWTQARDLGACLLNAGQPGKAINPLELYLKKQTEADDGDNVRKLLERARTEVARWN